MIKPKISIISPVYYKSNPYIQQTYDSLKNQTIQEWEWLILLNNGGKISDEIAKDKRVKILTEIGKDNNIGRLKKKLSLKATSEIIVELDADDMLTPNALQEIIQAFKDKKTHFAYSNTVEFFNDTWKPRTYDSYWGWKTKPFKYQDKELLETIAFPIYATTIMRIEWAPNHVRAWRKKSYQQIRGHNEELPSGDDHELMCKFFLEFGEQGFKWIKKPLYLYRVHDNNHSIVNNDEVQDIVQTNYFNYSRKIAVKWAQDKKLRLIDMSVDSEDWMDFEKININDLKKIKTNSVGVIKAHNILEKCTDPIKTMQELWRILDHGGLLFLEVVSSDCKHAFANPLNKSFWNEESTKFYTQKFFAEKIGFKGKFQSWRNETFYPTDWHKENDYLITQVDLCAIKKQTPILPGPQWQ
ncbi:MAG: glycosyltransferase family 2 protein [Candidatus Woesearchaeota archaeon]